MTPPTALRLIPKLLKRFGDTVSSLVIFGHAHPNANRNDFFEGFVKDAEQFEKPILYLHGDGHR